MHQRTNERTHQRTNDGECDECDEWDPNKRSAKAAYSAKVGDQRTALGELENRLESLPEEAAKLRKEREAAAAKLQASQQQLNQVSRAV